MARLCDDPVTLHNLGIRGLSALCHRTLPHQLPVERRSLRGWLGEFMFFSTITVIDWLSQLAVSETDSPLTTFLF